MKTKDKLKKEIRGIPLEEAIEEIRKEVKKEFLEIIDERMRELHAIQGNLRINELKLNSRDYERNMVEIEWGIQEYEELKSKIIGSQKNQTGAPETTPQKCFDKTENQTRGEDMPDEAPDKDSASGNNHSQGYGFHECPSGDSSPDKILKNYPKTDTNNSGDNHSQDASTCKDEEAMNSKIQSEDLHPDTNNSGDICKNCELPPVLHNKTNPCKKFEPLENNGGKDE